MTTPSFVMPYGVTVEASGEERSARAVTDSSHVKNGIRVVLPDGPCRVAASWDGPESVRLVHAGHGYPVVIPAGGGVSLRDGRYRCYEGRIYLPGEQRKIATRQGWARHNRGLSSRLNRVALRAGAVV